MSSWLEQLERELDARLSAFLRNNPVQEHLFSEQHLKDRAAALQRQRQQLQGEAKQQRQQLLRLAEDVRAWRSRVERARAAGAADLAGRAEQHLTSLMNQGRALWADLERSGTPLQRGGAAIAGASPAKTNAQPLNTGEGLGVV